MTGLLIFISLLAVGSLAYFLIRGALGRAYRTGYQEAIQENRLDITVRQEAAWDEGFNSARTWQLNGAPNEARPSNPFNARLDGRAQF